VPQGIWAQKGAVLGYSTNGRIRSQVLGGRKRDEEEEEEGRGREDGGAG